MYFFNKIKISGFIVDKK